MDVLALAPFIAIRPLVAIAVLVALAALRCWSLGAACSEDDVIRLLLSLPIAVAAIIVDVVGRALTERVLAIVRAVGDVVDRVLELAHVLLAIVAAMLATAHLLEDLLRPPPVASSEGLLAPSGGTFVVLVLAAGALAGVVATAYLASRRTLSRLDPDDALRLRMPLALVDVAVTVGGLVVVTLVPVLGAVLAVGVVAAIVGAWRLAVRLRTARLVPCHACFAPVDACALACPACHEERAAHAVGAFGRVRPDVVVDRERHARRLVLVGRCPSCAAVRGGALADACPACNAASFAIPTAVEIADEAARAARIPLIVAGACALLPVVGLPLALVVVRASPTSGVRRFLPVGARLRGAAVSLATLLVLALVQPLPVVGALVVVAVLVAQLALDRQAFVAAQGPASSSVGDARISAV